MGCDPRHHANVERRLKSAEPQADMPFDSKAHAATPATTARKGTRVALNNVQRFREAQMMSKAELARKAGLSTLTIDRVENGRPCRLDTKRKVLQALGLKIQDKDGSSGYVTHPGRVGQIRQAVV